MPSKLKLQSIISLAVLRLQRHRDVKPKNQSDYHLTSQYQDAAYRTRYFYIFKT